jgi:GT2 family glycosyltransferase
VSAASGVEMLGVVVIGRNEGERLERCLRSLVGHAGVIVYVDSGSTDGSQDFARSLGVEVLALDMSTGFTAARARNAGTARVRELAPGARFVQFVDGDCEVAPGWLEAGQRAFAADAQIAAVSGRLRERFPEKSLYNRLADLEWDRPVGEEKSCGGNAMMRVAAFMQVGGFDPTLIAGEEPELCARLRAAGLRIMRLADEMALHDIAMTTRAQWMKRAQRHGHAIVEVSYFRTPASRGLFTAQIRSALIWGLGWFVGVVVFYVLGMIATAFVSVWLGVVLLILCVMVLCGWAAQRKKIMAQGMAKGLDRSTADQYADLVLASKRQTVWGMASYLWDRVRGRRKGVIEYKGSSEPAQGTASR